MYSYNSSYHTSGGVTITTSRGGSRTTSIFKFPRFRDPRTALRQNDSNRYVPPDSGITANKPVPATRGGKIATKAMTYEELKAKLLQEGRLFEDPEFPTEDRSLYYSRAPPGRVIWLRPKEICKDPAFISAGASRFDVQQGQLGDCWLLAAIACLTTHKNLFVQVVPDDQDFGNGYCGLFRFHFWRFGEWNEVVVDDRLPTMRGELIYIHSSEKNEFWSALLEKAYAKLCGSYEALKGGTTCEALEDFTGGIGEMFDLREKAPSNLFNIMHKGQERQSLMACSIEADPNRVEAELPNGLIMGHAYSITSVKMLDLSSSGRGGAVRLVRVRNPWGNEAEWKGAWSDKSREWSLISDSDRRNVGLTFDDDGEFWMSYEDFIGNFQKLEICHLGPQSLGGGQGDQVGRHWEMCIEHGSWQRRISAGGCRNFLDTFWINPQYRVTVVDPDEDDEDQQGTLIVGLMQKHRRRLRQEGLNLLTIGYAIYELPPGFNGTLDKDFFRTHASTARSPAFINLREVAGRHKLKPATYAIIPSTFEPNEEADFMLRIFSEKPSSSEELDDTAGISEPKGTDESKARAPPMKKEQLELLRKAYTKVAGEDGEIDYQELLDILNVAFTRAPDLQYFKFDGFSTEAARSMVSMMDYDHSGMLNYEEFEKLWCDLATWKSAFLKYDTDKSGCMNSFELRNALKGAGFSVNNATFATLVLRFALRDGRVLFDDFISCCARLRTLFETFKAASKSSNGKAEFDENEFVSTIIYM